MSTRVIGLTGGVGMGKSTAARLFAKRGLPVVASDDLAREVVAPGQPALEEIAPPNSLFLSSAFFTFASSAINFSNLSPHAWVCGCPPSSLYMLKHIM